MVVGAANSAARKRSRPSGSAGSAGRDSRVAERPEGMADPSTEEQAPAAGAGAPGRGDVAVQDREELVVVPSPDLSVELAAVDLDDADDLEDAADLEDFPGTFDEEDLSVELAADLEIADSPDADLVSVVADVDVDVDVDAEPDLADEPDTDDAEAGAGPAAQPASADALSLIHI